MILIGKNVVKTKYNMEFVKAYRWFGANNKICTAYGHKKKIPNQE